MIERYTRNTMGLIWTDQKKFETWLAVEFAVIQAKCTLSKAGLLEPKIRNIKEVRRQLRKARKEVKINVSAIKRIEKRTRHDVMAFVTHVSNQLKKLGLVHLLPLFHQGMTSYDIQDTALSLLLIESLMIIKEDLSDLIKELKDKARLHWNQIQIGRTHGIQAEPITFGLKLLVYVDEFERHKERLDEVRRRIGVGKISGAVGTYANVDPSVEIEVCRILGLDRARISTQILPRDLHAEYVFLMTMIGCTLDKLATELRNLQRTEIDEVMAKFKKGAKGSSAMPHKRNPVGPENISSHGRTLRGFVVPALENMITWHERDIANSASERVILPDSSILVDYSLARMSRIIRELEVKPYNMKRNIELTGGLIFSQKVMLALTRKGMGREQAHNFIQKICLDVFENPGGPTFRERVNKNRKINQLLSKAEIDQCFDPKEDLKNIPAIFSRFRI